jgi:bifunctional non-homologous end joining protein LigD
MATLEKSSLKKEIIAGRIPVKISNPQKIYWPADKITKGQLLNYYNAMADYLLPHLKGRPLSLKRNPNGIDEPAFYHKDAGENAPAFVDVFKIKSGSNDKIIDYIVCNNKATLMYVANLGCIEMNPWNSTTLKKDYPTWMVIDIDPSDGNTFSEVIDVALATKEVLDRAKVSCYCKTSGSSGLHVYVPLKNKYHYDQVKDFAKIVAFRVEELMPGNATLERNLIKRGKRIYIDYLQNRIGQTLASAYSVRPVRGAWASAPLEWKEVNQRLHPSKFTMMNISARVKKKGDLFLPVLKETNSIEKALKVLE